MHVGEGSRVTGGKVAGSGSCVHVLDVGTRVRAWGDGWKGLERVGLRQSGGVSGAVTHVSTTKSGPTQTCLVSPKPFWTRWAPMMCDLVAAVA